MTSTGIGARRDGAALYDVATGTPWNTAGPNPRQMAMPERAYLDGSRRPITVSGRAIPAQSRCLAARPAPTSYFVSFSVTVPLISFATIAVGRSEGLSSAGTNRTISGPDRGNRKGI